MQPSIVRRCAVAAVLAIAAMLPQTPTLKTSAAGLALIADFEGCRLSAYQCSAGVWTNGIGHTAGAKPQTHISERQAAVNLVEDVMRVEKGIARCMPVNMPQPVYDAVASIAAAYLAERYPNSDTTDAGSKKAAIVESTVDDLWRDGRNAISDVAGVSHCIIGLL